LYAGRRTARLQMPPGRAICRQSWDEKLLAEALDAGVHFYPKCPVQLGEAFANGRNYQIRPLSGTQTLAARLVIIASGLSGAGLETKPQPVKNSWIGSGAVLPLLGQFPAGSVHMVIGQGGYVGFAQRAGVTDVSAAFERQTLAKIGKPGLLAAHICQEAGMEIAQIKDLAWTGTPALTHRLPTIGGERWLAVGDAASYIEPFTGEGISWALQSAVLVQKFALESLEAPSGAQAKIASLWDSTHARAFRNRRLSCRGVVAIAHRPWLAKSVIRFLSAWPGVTTPWVNAINRTVLSESE
jgi:menaquinone-9 beta-reductase